MNKAILVIFLSGLIIFSACHNHKRGNKLKSTKIKTATDSLELPTPYATKSAFNFSRVIGWKDGVMPIAPDGFAVSVFADSIKSSRWIYVLPNGDVLVSQANLEVHGIKKAGADIVGISKAQHLSGSPNQVTLFRDADHDGIPELREIFFQGHDRPFGMLCIGNSFYIASTDALWKYSYTTGDTRLKGEGQKILELPVGGYNNHWTRNIIANKDGTKIYISIGSGSNVGEHGTENEIRRANILEINPDGSGERVYASGLRNPVGMGWAPGTNALWTVVNERDNLGDELVPDYLTSLRDGGFYGWPYSYFGQHVDPRIDEKDQRPDLVSKAIVPDIALGSHTASLGLAFYTKKLFPQKYWNGIFIGQHGSWNSSKLHGYKVVFVPFKDGKPSGEPEDFLTGFIANEAKSEVYGRPVGVAELPDGSLLVADDAGDRIWRVTYK